MNAKSRPTYTKNRTSFFACNHCSIYRDLGRSSVRHIDNGISITSPFAIEIADGIYGVLYCCNSCEKSINARLQRRTDEFCTSEINCICCRFLTGTKWPFYKQFEIWVVNFVCKSCKKEMVIEFLNNVWEFIPRLFDDHLCTINKTIFTPPFISTALG